MSDPANDTNGLPIPAQTSGIIQQTEIPKIIRQRSQVMTDLGTSLQDLRNKYLQDSDEILGLNTTLSNFNNSNNNVINSNVVSGKNNGMFAIDARKNQEYQSKRASSMFPDFESTRNRSNTLATSDSYNSYYSSSLNDNSDEYNENEEADLDASNGNFQIGSHQNSSPTWLLADILQCLGDKEKGPAYLVSRANEFVSLLQNNENLKEEIVLSSIAHRIQTLLLDPSADVIASGYRVLRYTIADYNSLMFLSEMNIDYFIISSLTKDAKLSLNEREEALKLVRKYIEIENGLHELSVGCVRSVVSIAESPDDPLRIIALETIVEISLIRAELAFQANAFKCFLPAMLDYPFPIASLCIVPIIKLLELPTTRPYILDEHIIESLIVPFMDSHAKVEKLQIAAFIITIFLKTWTGYLAFSTNNFIALKQLIECLSFESSVVKSIIIHIFLDIFRVKPLPWVQSPPNLNDLQYFSFSQFAINLSSQKSNLSSRSFPEREPSFINHFTALLLQASLKCGLIDELKKLYENSKEKPVKKAVILLSEISYLKSYLMPSDTTPSLDPPFGLNALIEKDLRKHHSTNMIFNTVNKPRKLSKDANNKLKVSSYAIDEDELKKMILNTGVLTSKEYSTWNLNLIIELFQGPLRDPKRLEDADRKKFIKRLMSFFRPFKRRFAEKGRTKHSQNYIKVGCELLKCLLSNDVGVKYLSENKILPQIADCLAQIVPFSGITAKDPLFSRHSLETSLCYGYFSFIGVLSADSNGIKMLERWSIFDMLYQVSNRISKRDDVVKLVLNELNYDIPGHSRIILSKVAATAADTHLRLHATRIIGNLLMDNEECEDFAVYHLVNQLCNPRIEICNLAIEFLTKYAKDDRKISKIIQYKPPVHLLGNAGSSLMLGILSSTSGFQFLQEINYVEVEMELWIDSKNKEYVRNVETFIMSSLFQSKSLAIGSLLDSDRHIIDSIPYHFFGALVKTPHGLDLLDSTETFSSFMDIIKSYVSILETGDEFSFYTNFSKEEQEDTLVELKSIIWAIGHIGSSEYGISSLELSGTVDQICYICKNSTNWSLKGTCLYAMGLIANTNQGLEILDDLGWTSMTSCMGDPLGVCVPREKGAFYPSDEPLIIDTSTIKIPSETSGETFEKIMYEFFPSLQNTQKSSNISIAVPEVLNEIYENLVLVLASPSKAYNNLNKIKNKNPKIFATEPALLRLIMVFLEKFKVKTSARRFLIVELLDFNRLMEVLFKRNRQKLKERQQQGASQQLIQSQSSRLSLDKMPSHSYQRTYSQVSKQVQLQLQQEHQQQQQQQQQQKEMDIKTNEFSSREPSLEHSRPDLVQSFQPVRSHSQLKRKPPPEL